jgi:hypothetical protein
MLSREDFICTIGYDGPAAVVDKQAKRRYGSLSTRELAEKGLFRAAYSSALYSGDPGEMETVVEIYNRTAGASLTVSSNLMRLFGVFLLDVKKVLLI